ncbi:hypothetical protein DMC30DRAFT_177691 [Rhodotorula diobovata]|uniref:Uncharacterized protein n=1 Tax=Rhodotorula diobovata TaxID=5288 RepID=A0A5C5FYN1_9BASI|nr:hypothetical protein DMC30DRAFT_177691 [Rhodotorula diobovata]
MSSVPGSRVPPPGYESGHFKSPRNGSSPLTDQRSPQRKLRRPCPTQTAPSFKDQVNAYSKKFAGKVFGKEHEVVLGESLQEGRGKDQALTDAEIVKERNASA